MEFTTTMYLEELGECEVQCDYHPDTGVENITCDGRDISKHLSKRAIQKLEEVGDAFYQDLNLVEADRMIDQEKEDRV